MRSKLVILSALLTILVLFMPSIAAASATGELAGIIMNLNHRPSPMDKQRLMEIIDEKSTTAGEKTLAKALMNMEHHVASSDKDRLNQMIHDSSTPDDERELAEILVNLNHHASAEDKVELKKITGK